MSSLDLRLDFNVGTVWRKFYSVYDVIEVCDTDSKVPQKSIMMTSR